MLHVDLYGPIAKQSLSGKKYILMLIDEFSRFTWFEFVRKKSHVLMLLINLLKRLQVPHGVQVRVIRSDNGIKFKNPAIEDYLTSVGITHNFSAPRTPQHNGVVERKNITLGRGTEKYGKRRENVKNAQSQHRRHLAIAKSSIWRCQVRLNSKLGLILVFGVAKWAVWRSPDGAWSFFFKYQPPPSVLKKF
ncbi:hypothetical protein OSB04_031851 [Centaurea solstitialis]|uniref:Integrase catalytic domain-containing protein n=1 Tax=Centaurea solstitialis TaxID=347529 RepID=A0AA38SHT8_9ASTR|nr:hypothetical protein OSB04_031851 [Centaurea solstitialis]